MRYLHSDRKCPVCKAENEVLIVADDDISATPAAATTAEGGRAAVRTTRRRKKFADYPVWGDEVVGGTYVRREDVGMHFPSALYDTEVSSLLGYGCGMPRCEYDDGGDIYVCERADNNSKGGGSVDPKRPQMPQRGRGRETKKRLAGLPALKSHLRIEHGYTLCDLCADNKRDFVSKLARYTPRGLKDHEARGDGDDSGFRGHPLCEFCKPTRFYDVVKLHEHLNREHYKCHVCDKSGKPNVFFKDYDNLERHFDRDHYLCRDPQCLAARFVVFENDIDLRGHEVCVHGKTSNGGNAKIRLEFRVRRGGDENALRDHQSVPTGDDFQYGLDGEAFVPEALPDQRGRSSAATTTRQANEREITHPVHAARTAELREQAARVRARDGIVVGGGTGAGGVAGAGEAFPALGATTDASSDGTVMLVGWTSDGVRAVAGGGGGYGGGGRARRPGGLSRTSAGEVTEEEFPSLGGPSSSSGGRVVGHMGRTRTRPTTTAATGLRFSAAAASSSISTTTTTAAIARPTSSSSASSSSSFGRFVPSALTTLSSSSFRAAPVPNLTSAENFPSLLGGGYGSSSSSSASPATTTTAARSNPYAAVRAHARKLNNGGGGILAPSFAPSDFPPPPSSSSNAAKNARIVDAFAPKKKPPPLNDVLQFPPPSLVVASSSSSSSLAAKKAPLPPLSAESLESGRETVQSLKQLLGAARFKRLRALTRDVACGAIPPERYVDGAASLFDRGIGDAAFWESIPPLIRDIPNAAAADGAVVYLESIRMANEMQELEFGSGISGGGGGGGKKPINFVLPKATRKKKMTNSWGN